MNNLSDFTNAKLGDPVWCLLKGEGVITSITNSAHYPIKVAFQDEQDEQDEVCSYSVYTLDGKIIKSHKNATLFNKSIKIVTIDTPEPFEERVMEVSVYEDFKDKKIRVVFMEKNGKFMAWNNAETLEDSKKSISATPWPYAREINSNETEIKEIQDQINQLQQRLNTLSK
jgi:hypothetical protein